MAGVGVSVFAFLLILTGCDSQDLGDSNPQTPTLNVIATEVQALNTFGQALQRVGPGNVLTGSGPYTVFAPTNGAFDPAISVDGNTGVLQKVLQHHVVDGVYVDTTFSLDDGEFSNATEFDDPSVGGTLQPLVGDPLSINAEGMTVNHATIINPDVSAQEGIVHVVDGLLADAVDRATLTPQFTIFSRLVKEVNLESTLRSSGPNDGLTIFAPTNDAILGRLDANGNGEIENNEMPANLEDVLQYHVHTAPLMSTDLPADTTVSTLEGTTVNITSGGDGVSVNPNDENASVSIPNVEVDNGVIHGIDAILVP